MTSGVYNRPSVINKILYKIKKDKITKCWNFKGSLNTGDRYGVIKRKGKNILVHRYMFYYYNIKPLGTSWEEFSESCSDLEVCHRCDNPACCNPKHLFLGTRSTNIQDCKHKGRINRTDKARGEKQGNHKLTEKQVLKIYRMEGTQQSIADKFGIYQSQVSRIKKGESWNWFHKKLNKK